LSRALRARGVIPDFRPPDLLRLCPSPLYTSFAECERAVNVIDELLTNRSYETLADRNALVT
jgi:kynureninase